MLYAILTLKPDTSNCEIVVFAEYYAIGLQQPNRNVPEPGRKFQIDSFGTRCLVFKVGGVSYTETKGGCAQDVIFRFA